MEQLKWIERRAAHGTTLRERARRKDRLVLSLYLALAEEPEGSPQAAELMSELLALAATERPVRESRLIVA